MLFQNFFDKQYVFYYHLVKYQKRYFIILNQGSDKLWNTGILTQKPYRRKSWKV
jgi:hypothetical protein